MNRKRIRDNILIDNPPDGIDFVNRRGTQGERREGRDLHLLSTDSKLHEDRRLHLVLLPVARTKRRMGHGDGQAAGNGQQCYPLLNRGASSCDQSF